MWLFLVYLQLFKAATKADLIRDLSGNGIVAKVPEKDKIKTGTFIILWLQRSGNRANERWSPSSLHKFQAAQYPDRWGDFSTKAEVWKVPGDYAYPHNTIKSNMTHEQGDASYEQISRKSMEGNEKNAS